MFIHCYSFIQMDLWERVSAGSPGSGSRFLVVFLRSWNDVSRTPVGHAPLTLREAN